MNYLTFNAATIAKDCVMEAIKRIERGIESCGVLTHKDAKQSDSSKEYFAKHEKDLKSDIELLKRFSAELSKQAWDAYSLANNNKEG